MKTPPQEVFDEIKEKCIEIWNTYDNTHGYATEKINRIKDLENVGDNYLYMLRMFDINNMDRVYTILSSEAKGHVQNELEVQFKAMIKLLRERPFC